MKLPKIGEEVRGKGSAKEHVKMRTELGTLVTSAAQ
jgi:hypothetical protein